MTNAMQNIISLNALNESKRVSEFQPLNYRLIVNRKESNEDQI